MISARNCARFSGFGDGALRLRGRLLLPVIPGTCAQDHRSFSCAGDHCLRLFGESGFGELNLRLHFGLATKGGAKGQRLPTNLGSAGLPGPLPDSGQFLLHDVGRREEFVQIGLAFDEGNSWSLVLIVRQVAVVPLLHGVPA